MRDEDRRNGQRVRGRREADLFGIGIAGHDNRMGSVRAKDRQPARVPGNRTCGAARDQETVPPVDAADYSQRPHERFAGRHQCERGRHDAAG